MAAIDNHATYQPGLDSPAIHAEVVTPDDDNDLTYVSRAVSIATAGNLKVTTHAGETVVLPVPAGILPLRVSRIHATSTTAAGIVALS